MESNFKDESLLLIKEQKREYNRKPHRALYLWKREGYHGSCVLGVGHQ